VTDTRARIVAATSALFMRQGVNGTGLKAIAEASDATTGSLYHFFPGGKGELAAAVLRHSGAAYAALVMRALVADPDPVQALRSAFAEAAQGLRDTDYVDACPIATVALEVASSDEALRLVVDEVFTSWLVGAGAWFEAAGVPSGRARVLATQLIALLEGGFLLSRVARSTEAMDHVGAAIADLLESALAPTPV
jgi:AcrR family transcriptional regulator